ncbi:MAG: carbohydrate ABC transporter permease [Lachnospiraceae bacterium]|nr:carbohydrate ABC transporter permease [Lachnospiraceae bacterium]
MKKAVWKKFRKLAVTMLMFLTALIICMPVILLVSGSLKGTDELSSGLAPVLGDANYMAEFGLLPRYPTLRHYLELLFDTPEYYVVFGNSLKIVIGTLAGQLLVGIPSAWAFARFTFPGRKILFTIYTILMMMPFSVTMLSSYLVLHDLSLLDNLWGIILPGVFSTFPVFIMYRGFCGIPKGLLEAARVDGAGEFQIFIHMGLPLGSAGIGSALVLGFLEYFSLIEQPLAFLKNKSLWPLSLYLPQIGLSDAGYAFAASAAALIPAVFVFLLGQDYLEKGIIATGMKE